MAITETTTQSWFSRILESIKGILVGVVMFALAVPLIFINECSSVETAKSLAAGRDNVVMADADTVDPAKEGKLVHLSGLATTDEVLRDPVFGLSVNAIKLDRSVEMYQWTEKQKKETRKKVGGGEETVTTYTYEQTWDDDLIPSSSFKEQKGHLNPAEMPFDQLDLGAKRVTLGAFVLSDSLVSGIQAWEDIPASEEMKASTSADLQAQLQIHDNRFFIGAAPTAPRVGDVRVGFRVVKPSVVSVVAGQKGATLGAWQTPRSSKSVELLTLGNIDADEMFADAESANTVFTWILRAVSWFMMFFGLTLIGRPFAVVADLIPFVGSFFRAGVAVFAFLVASAVWFMTVAVAWIAVRPVLGICLFMVGGTAMAMMVLLAVVLGRRAMASASDDPEPEAA